MSVQLTVYAARVGDLLKEAKAEMDDDDFADLLVLASSAIAKHVADRLEQERR